jgi:hypothetical protein
VGTGSGGRVGSAPVSYLGDGDIVHIVDFSQPCSVVCEEKQVSRNVRPEVSHKILTIVAHLGLYRLRPKHVVIIPLTVPIFTTLLIFEIGSKVGNRRTQHVKVPKQEEC